MKSWILLLSLCSLSSAWAVPIHKWVDSNGMVHYSNVAPDNGKTQLLEYKGLGNTSNLTKKEESKSGEVDPEVKKKIEAEKEMARQNCIRSRESVQMLESGVRISRVNAKGEKEVLDEKGRVEEMERAKKAVKDWCNE